MLSAASLDSAISAASTETTAAATRPTGFQMGAAHVALGAYATVNYDDNINGSQYTPETDLITQAGANLGFDWPVTDHSDLNFGSGIGYIYYARYINDNGLEINPNSALTYAISLDDVTLTFYDQMSYSREVTSQASLANVAVLPRFDNVVGIRSEWAPGQWIFQLGYSHDDYLTDSATEYLNRSSEYFYGKAGWLVADATQFGVEASGSLTTYQIAGQANYDSFSVGGYADWQLRPALHILLRGGPTIYEYYYPPSSGGTSQLTSYYLTLEVQHQLTDYLSQNLRVERDVQPGSSQGSDYVEQLTANYTLNYALTQYINVIGMVTVEDGTQPYVNYIYTPFGDFPVSTTTEHYQRYGEGLQATWQVTKRWSSSLGYHYWLRDSNVAGRSYSENSVSLNLTYTF